MQTKKLNIADNSNKKSIAKTALIIFALICFLLPKQGFGQTPQCSFQLTNALSVVVVVQVEWFDSCPGTPGPNCDLQTFTLTANSSQTPTCNCVNPICNVLVTLVTINSGGITSGVGYVDNGVWFSQTDSGTYGPPAGTYSMQYNTAVWNINP